MPGSSSNVTLALSTTASRSTRVCLGASSCTTSHLVPLRQSAPPSLRPTVRGPVRDRPPPPEPGTSIRAVSIPDIWQIADFYCAKPNARNRIPGTNGTENAFVWQYRTAHRSGAGRYQGWSYGPSVARGLRSVPSRESLRHTGTTA
eukprot:2238501-Rhodomonas_salina.2